MMKLTIVGCGGSLSGPESAASGYLVQAPYQDRIFSLLLDCGPGAMGALYRYLDPRELDAIALSHPACRSLSGPVRLLRCRTLLTERPLAAMSRIRPCQRRLADRPGIRRSGQRLRGGELVNPLTSILTGVPGSPASRSGRSRSARYGLRIRWRRTAFGWRRRNRRHHGVQRRYRPNGSLGPARKQCQLAARGIGFSRWPGQSSGIHLSGAQAAAVRQAARVGAVVLTHIPPWHEPERVLVEAKPHFDGPLCRSRCLEPFGTSQCWRLSS